MMAVLERWAEILLLGLRNLLRNKLRSFLTMLGMIFGVGSVIAMLSVGAGARHEILARIGELGINNIIVNSVKPPQEVRAAEDEEAWVNRYGLLFTDRGRIEETCPTVSRVLPVNVVRERAWAGSKRVDVSVLGVVPQHMAMFRLVVARGRPLSPLDEADEAKVCVIRREVARKLGFVGDPLGMNLRIGAFPFEVVGILEDEAFRSHTRKALAIDEGAQEVYVPYSTSMRTFGTFTAVVRTGSYEYTEVELDQIVVEARSPEVVVPTARMISAMLGHEHEKADYEIVVPLELLQQSEKTQQVFNVVMVLIASISLLIGGIGIANIMLATITERTTEIGIRRALGARRRDVMSQFLVETLAIAAIGGLFGALFGIAGVKGIVRFTQWEALIAPHYVGVALLISCGVGILSGIYPARRAAAMDPIRALRYE
jgi:putative ABC transport system permease protein